MESETTAKLLISFLEELRLAVEKIRGELGDIIVEKKERTLDEVVDVRGEVEYGGGSENHIVLDPGEIAGDGYSEEIRGLDISFIDSSSRSIGFNPLRITIAAVAVKTKQGLFIEPYNTVNWDFIAVKSYRSILERLEKLVVGLRVRNPCGEYYDEEYKDDNIGDELRLEIENHALENTGGESLVVVDGPVYPTPEVLFYRGSNRYKRAFLKIISNRISIAERNKGVIIGFVKRTEYSRKLWREPTIRTMVREETGRDPANLPDPVIVEYLVERRARPRVNEWRVLGPFRIEYGDSILRPKIFYYLALKSVHTYHIYRVEVLEEDYDRNPDLVEAAVRLLLENTSLRGIPLELELVDKASRRTTAALYLLVREYLAGLISLAYDEIGKESVIIRELLE